jgi:hypothetical protein
VRVGGAFLLARLFACYLRRRVLSSGPLSSPLVRIAMAGATVASGVAMTLGIYLFLEHVGAGSVDPLLFRLSSVSTLTWVTIVFVFVKLMFVKAGGLLTFTYSLPVTNRERAASLAAFEAAFVVFGSCGLFAPLMVATSVFDPRGAVLGIGLGIAAPMMIGYLLLGSLFNASTLVAASVGLRRVADMVGLAVVGSAGLVYNAMSTGFAQQISAEYLKDPDHIGWHGADALVYLAESYGVTVSIATALLALALALAMFLATLPPWSADERRFVLLVGSPTSLWGAYVAAMLRRSEYVALSVTAALFAVYLGFRGSSSTAWVACALAFQGIYAYTGTTSLRALPMRRTASHVEYALLVLSQVVVVAVGTVPILCVAMATGSISAESVWVGAACVSGVVLLTAVGIIFPPDRDNPFSAFVSYSVTLVLITSLAAVLGVLQLSRSASILILVAIHVVAVAYSISGITSLHSKERYA